MAPIACLAPRAYDAPQHVLPAAVSDYDPTWTHAGTYHAQDGDDTTSTTCGQYTRGWTLRAAWRAAEAGAKPCPTCYPFTFPEDTSWVL